MIKSINFLKDVRNWGKKNKQLKYELFICLAFGGIGKRNSNFPVSFAATVMKMNLCVCLNVYQGHGQWQTGFS